MVEVRIEALARHQLLVRPLLPHARAVDVPDPGTGAGAPARPQALQQRLALPAPPGRCHLQQRAPLQVDGVDVALLLLDEDRKPALVVRLDLSRGEMYGETFSRTV